MSAQQLCGIAAVIVGMFAFVPYIFAIFGRGMSLKKITPTKPERVTWFIWFILGAELLAMNYFLGARESLPLIVMYAAAYFVISVLSIWKGTGGWTTRNIVCLSGGVLAAVLWIALTFYGSSDLAGFSAIIVTGIADVCAFWPTIVHAWEKPAEENRTGWTLGYCGAMINLFAITYSFDFAGIGIALFPLYNAFFMGVIVAALWTSPYRAFGIQRKRFRSA